MLLLFPTLDTFRLVLDGGFVPSSVALAPAMVACADDGRLSVETEFKPTKTVAADLTRLGVAGAKRHVAEPFPVGCWPQIVPADRDPHPPQLSSQAPILFDLEHANDLPILVGEMLRLGNDRQSVRWVAATDDPGTRRALLRVIGPPYYTLLRAIDHTAGGTTGTVRAYAEPAPRVWVEVGYTHPYAHQLKVDDEQIVLIRAGRDWTFLPDAPFRDVYDGLQFTLPASAVPLAPTPPTAKLLVPLKLAPGNATDPAELWVLRGPEVEQLDGFVRDADERLVQRLKFAAGNAPSGDKIVVLRTTASKLAPPVLPLAGGVGFKPFFKLANLYLPTTARLHPTLRRDAVRTLLADDPDRLVWLFPGPAGTFTPESLPEDSFRPLTDWVDYVVEANRTTLATWVAATTFDFDAFVCSDGSAKPKDPGDGGKGKKKPRPDVDLEPLQPTGGKPSGSPVQEVPGTTEFALISGDPKPPSAAKLKLESLEAEFLAVDGPLDAIDRQRLWPALAAGNAALGQVSEAAVCWVNALWTTSSLPSDWVEAWYHSEFPNAPPLNAFLFDRLMLPAEPTSQELRQFAVALLWLTGQPTRPTWLAAKLPAARTYLETHERKLPVRAVWLVAVRLAAVAGADTLGLARTRDRILHRLLESGINSELDLPSFLRYAGLKDSDRVRAVREQATSLHQDVRRWTESSLRLPGAGVDQEATVAYVDLMFSFGLAKLGEVTAARSLLESGRRILDAFSPTDDRGLTAHFLVRAFRQRIETALLGLPHTGLLDPALATELDALHAKSNGQANNVFGRAYYAISRIRQQSRILEPQEKNNPYEKWMGHGDPLQKALAGLPDVREASGLARSVRELYRQGADGKPTPDTRFAVLVAALPLAARVGEQFTLELLGLVPDAVRGSQSLGTVADLGKKQGHLIERAIFLAAHFDRRETVAGLIDLFVQVAAAKPDDQRFELVNAVAGQSFRSLRKLDLRDDIGKLLRKLSDAISAGKPLAEVKTKYSNKPDAWSKALQSHLNIAGGWLTFGIADQAIPALDAARAELLGPTKLTAIDFTALAQAYVAALGQGPADLGIPRIAELFHEIPPVRVTNAWSTREYYSRLHLNLVEEVVLAIVSDEFALGPAGRRWLDDDEYVVRKRVHADLRKLLDKAGL